MKIIIKFSPEITIKSSSVRLCFIKILYRNISIVLNSFNYFLKIKWYWDYIEISLNEDDDVLNIIGVLVHIPGIHHILLVEKYFFKEKYDIFERIFPIYQSQLIGKSFCVRVKRQGKHIFTSQDLERYLGAALCANIKNSVIKLTNFNEIINLEVKNNYFLLLKSRYEGLCGFPISTQGEVLSLISGGFDSGIASYMLIRRGCKVHYCFFKIGGDFHENKVREVVFFLWRKFGCSHSVKFISVDFSLVINEIMQKINHTYMGVVLKRMMIRAATSVAKYLKIPALVTGEALGQVSSQTLINLKLINDITNIMIFRPLISYDKSDIIALSRKIGIESFSVNIPEYCGIISKKPTAKGSVRSIDNEEKKFDFSILERSVNQKKIINISKIIVDNNKINEIEPINVKKLNNAYVIIDIRTQDEQENHPLYIEHVEVKKIPFYKLYKVFPILDQSKIYLLYCGQGIMSYSQVLYLKNQGFDNVNVYLP